ncbi:unnamed protein product [Mytilus coruscus]|uniref:Uncharacterized protein n=1 Tax=Mytilus coruscus TaxID=42192 RepID=A0A6J8CPN0_MYTCO|nr:unnamed protein product [Mytilus coruscus]
MDDFTYKSGYMRDTRKRKFLFTMPEYTAKDISMLKSMFNEKGEYMIIGTHGRLLRVFFVFLVNKWRHYIINTFSTRIELLDDSIKDVNDIIHFCSNWSNEFEEFGSRNKINCGKRNDLVNAIKDEKEGKKEKEMLDKYKGTWTRYRRYIRAKASDEKMAAYENVTEQ